MTYQTPQPPLPEWNPPPLPQHRKPSHTLRNVVFAVLGVLGVLVVVIVAVAAAAGSTNKPKGAAIHTSTHSSASASRSAPPIETTSEAPAPVLPPVPDPSGTVTGTCAYELSGDLNNYETHAADMNVDVDAESTGNIGIVVKVTVTVPQLGHTAIKMVKNVRVPTGQTVTLHLTRVLSQSEISRLQSWQEGHNYDSGCTYNGDVVDTYGSAS